MLPARRTGPFFAPSALRTRVSITTVSRLPGYSRLRSQFAPTSSPQPESIPADVLVDEEIVPGYDWKAFYPAHTGELLDNRYELKVKVGWGSSSTVWLAEDVSL